MAVNDCVVLAGHNLDEFHIEDFHSLLFFCFSYWCCAALGQSKLYNLKWILICAVDGCVSVRFVHKMRYSNQINNCCT